VKIGPGLVASLLRWVDPVVVEVAVMSIQTLLCRLNLHHVWHTETTEDGSRFRRCVRCGRDEGTPDSEPTDQVPPIA
jgi:hypothetical protein